MLRLLSRMKIWLKSIHEKYRHFRIKDANKTWIWLKNAKKCQIIVWLRADDLSCLVNSTSERDKQRENYPENLIACLSQERVTWGQNTSTNKRAFTGETINQK